MLGGGGYATNLWTCSKMFGGVMPKYFRDLKKNVGGGGLCPNKTLKMLVGGGGGYANKFYGLKKIVEGRGKLGVGVCQQILWT